MRILEHKRPLHWVLAFALTLVILLCLTVIGVRSRVLKTEDEFRNKNTTRYGTASFLERYPAREANDG